VFDLKRIAIQLQPILTVSGVAKIIRYGICFYNNIAPEGSYSKDFKFFLYFPSNKVFLILLTQCPNSHSPENDATLSEALLRESQ
jgi:hypothetical protein